MRIRIVLAAVVAMLAMSAAPASAVTGWTFHSGGYNDDIFFQNPCLDTGQALVAAGTIADFQCRYNTGNHLFDLYTVAGPWTFHSGGYNDDIFFQNPCMDTGLALVANGTITTFQCRWGANGLVALWVIV
jgi:hypothetical protein